MKQITYISFGAGVQSTALLVLSNLEKLGCPRADVAVFADTGDEPSWVYENVDRMREWSHRIPVVTVKQGHLSKDTLERPRFASIPAFSRCEDGRAGPLRRQCTNEYKIRPIERWVREHLGLEKGDRAKGVVEVVALIGISLDEATRMKPSRTPWVKNRYPLVEAGLRRHDCARVIRTVGLPVPQKSSCVFCPYHSDDYWRRLRKDYPKEFERAAQFDEAIRLKSSKGMGANPIFLHRSLVPLREIRFDRQRRLFPDLEDEECEGGCFL